LIWRRPRRRYALPSVGNSSVRWWRDYSASHFFFPLEVIVTAKGGQWPPKFSWVYCLRCITHLSFNQAFSMCCINKLVMFWHERFIDNTSWLISHLILLT
jgi:hypothetical protein